MIVGITSNAIQPCILVDLTLVSGTYHVWSGVGSLTVGATVYLGLGSLGSIGDVSEGIDVRADGTSITLSGIDPAIMADCLSDIQLGAPATVWFALFSDGAIVGTPYPLYVGTVDKPTIPISTESISITLNLENRMLNLQRPTMRRYDAGDQNYYYPGDSGFNWVQILNDTALQWG
jgi:hypothetical protein